MSVSCVGTCQSCGVQRWWLSDTKSLQLDDGTLVCLPHPGEGRVCEKEYGLTLEQASARDRLCEETFYICRSCGREGEVIEKLMYYSTWGSRRGPSNLRKAWAWGLSVGVVGFGLLWLLGWKQTATVVGLWGLFWPLEVWRENRKLIRGEWAKKGNGLPRDDAPGKTKVEMPTRGVHPKAVVGSMAMTDGGKLKATGACCAKPDWVEAALVKDEDQVPCIVCEKGMMKVGDWSIH